MDTIKTDKSTDLTEKNAKENTPEAAEDAQEARGEAGETAGQPAEENGEGHQDVLDDDIEDAGDEDFDVLAVRESASSGVGSGAAAIVGLGLAFFSITGTWLGTQMAQREQLIGQIKSQSGSASDQLHAAFATPMHSAALFNGLFALVAVLVAIGVLVWQRVSLAPPAAPWVKAVAWGALVIGVIGLVIAGFMLFDVFTSLPTIPASTGQQAPPTG